MRKIISLFKRDYEGTRRVFDEIVPGAEWVANGEGVATRKYDGTCCMVKGGKLYKRYDAKQGKTPPEGFIAAQDPDPKTGHHPGWLLVTDKPDERWHLEAWGRMPEEPPEGTYELVGPKVQGNPEGYKDHVLLFHAGADAYPDFPRTFDAIREAFKGMDVEGVVWHHPDGRMVKIKKKDFGLKRSE